MRRYLYGLVILSAASLASAWGQSGPRLGYVYPAGGQQGIVVRVAVGGQLLGGAEDVYIAGEGVRGRVVEYVRPLSEGEQYEAAQCMHDLVRKRWNAKLIAAAKAPQEMPLVADHPWLRDLDERTPKDLALLRAKLLDPKKQLNAQIAEQVDLEITIDPKAAPGDRELRVLTASGMTNPVRFQVGVLPEVREDEYGLVIDPDPAPVDLPVLLNGQITPGDVDRFALRAHKGQQLAIRMQARRLIPYLADAVPGWFQPAMALYDPQGGEVAYAGNFRFDPDPVLFYKIPADGVYRLQVNDALYRGRDDFVYRIAVGELPFITGMFPLGGPAGVPTVAQITGWNLPVDKLPLDTRAGGGAIRQTTIAGSEGLCNDAPYAVSELPEIAEVEPNDASLEAQKVTLPVVVNGRIGKPGDVDTFSFEGKSGDEIVAEVYARRLNSPLDAMLRLTDAAGQVVAWNDDQPDPEMGLVTHQADSYLRAKLPRDGVYRVALSDTQRQGGDAFAYRLRLGPSQPDFAVRVTPSTVTVSAGGAVHVTLRSVRKDGFDGDIDVALKDAPVGFAVSNGHIAKGKNSAEMTLSVPRGLPHQAFRLRFEAHAQVGVAAITHPVAPAEDMMQAFAYQHLVPQQEFVVAIPGHRGIPAVWRPLLPGVELTSATPVQIPQGGTVQVRLTAPQDLRDRLQAPLLPAKLELASPVRGVRLQSVAVGPDGLTLTLKADGNATLVGDASSVIAEAYTESVTPATDGSALPRRERVSLGVLPAIAFQIVRP